MKEKYILMHKDEPVVIVNIDEIGKITTVSEKSNKELLPIGCNMENIMLKKWWNKRATPITQENILNLLEQGNHGTIQEFLTKNLGLSMTDHYWIKPIDSDLKWRDVNLFENDFNDADDLKNLDNENNIDSKYLFTPSSSVQGELKKKWVVENGERYLIKGNHGKTFQQSLNEMVACLVHQKQEWNKYTNYESVQKQKGGLSNSLECKCKAFTNNDIEFISAIDVVDSEKKRNDISQFEHFINVCYKHGLSMNETRAFLEYQILTDFAITNTDRHFNNFGVLRDTNTLRFIGMANIFDSGNSMFWNKGLLEIPKSRAELTDIDVVSFRKKERGLLEYISMPELIDLGKLPTIEELKQIYSKDRPENELKYGAVYKCYEEKILILDSFIQKGNVEISSRYSVTNKGVDIAKRPKKSNDMVVSAKNRNLNEKNINNVSKTKEKKNDMGR